MLVMNPFYKLDGGITTEFTRNYTGGVQSGLKQCVWNKKTGPTAGVDPD